MSGFSVNLFYNILSSFNFHGLKTLTGLSVYRFSFPLVYCNESQGHPGLLVSQLLETWLLPFPFILFSSLVLLEYGFLNNLPFVWCLFPADLIIFRLVRNMFGKYALPTSIFLYYLFFGFGFFCFVICVNYRISEV